MSARDDYPSTMHRGQQEMWDEIDRLRATVEYWRTISSDAMARIDRLRAALSTVGSTAMRALREAE